MTQTPADEQRRLEAEQRLKREFHAAQVAEGVELSELEALPKGALAGLLNLEKLLKGHLAHLLGQGQPEGGLEGSEDARYRLSIILRGWNHEQVDLGRLILASRALDTMRIVARVASGLAEADDSTIYAVLSMLGMASEPGDIRDMRQWAKPIAEQYRKFRETGEIDD